MGNNLEKIKKRMIEDGFTKIIEYSDPPNETFSEHTHKGDQLIVIVEGSISVTMNGSTKTLGPGEEMFFGSGIKHSAKVGAHGCFYIDGERSTAH